jgi:hypothetical protein
VNAEDGFSLAGPFGQLDLDPVPHTDDHVRFSHVSILSGDHFGFKHNMIHLSLHLISFPLFGIAIGIGIGIEFFCGFSFSIPIPISIPIPMDTSRKKILSQRWV